MISEFKAGAKICQSVLMKRVGTSSNGAPFARGLLEDNSGKIPFITFEAPIVEKLRDMDGPAPMMVSGSVDINKFSGEMALQVIFAGYHQKSQRHCAGGRHQQPAAGRRF